MRGRPSCLLQSARGEANRILLASALSSMRIICPNKVSRHDWIIAVSLGCFVSLRTSSFRTNWYHLRRFLLAYTGFQYASESATRWRCLCGSVYTMQPLATWLTCVCRLTPCVVTSNCVPRRLGLCWSRTPGLLLVSAASPSMDHEHGTVCQPILEHQIRLCALSSVISRPTCFSSSLRCC